MWSSTISPTNSKKLLIGSIRSVDYVGDSAKTAAANNKTAATGAATKGSATKSQQKPTTTTTIPANTTKISIEMEIHIQNKCISA